MDYEEPLPIPKPPRKLEEMSIEELTNLIAACEVQIAEAQETIAAKQGARGDADAVFKK